MYSNNYNFINFQELVLSLLIEEKKLLINKPRRIRKGEPGYGKKKFVVRAKEGSQEKIIRFGDANLKIKKHIPSKRKAFRARHKCDNPGSKLKARY